MNPVRISYERDGLLTPQASELLHEHYMLSGEVSPQDAFARASWAFAAGDIPLAQRIYDAVSQLHFMFSSPVLSNAPVCDSTGRPLEAPKNLPISCFLAYVPDTRRGLIDHQKELAWLSVMGGGVGGHWDDVRPSSKKAPGTIPFLKVADSGMLAWKQGNRRGSYAGYLSVSHPDILEFLSLRVPTGGDINRKTLNLHHAINITDDFMQCVDQGLMWNLICPHSKEVRGEVKARTLWERILETRFRTGEPYLNFIDTANAGLHPAQRALGLAIRGSNLCNEIHLPTNEDRTAVCCLSSMNLETYDEWAPTLVADVTRLLDNVLTCFIEWAPPELHRAVFSATAERSLGIGSMGFHSYLQKYDVPFESEEASALNLVISEYIQAEAIKESEWLAIERGEPSDLIGTGRRNAYLLAIAPNANSSIITGCSPSIEAWRDNYFVHRTRIGSHVVKNKYLQVVLAGYAKDTQEVWESVLEMQGSVQHLEFLTQRERDIFKTFGELDQHWVVRHAATRQRHVCQGQSVNLFFPAKSPRNYVNSVHRLAHKLKLKGLYYLRTTTGHAAENVNAKVARIALGDAAATTEECVACHG
jgi:ribonucleoside-diphosphate reductase alpha chain